MTAIILIINYFKPARTLARAFMQTSGTRLAISNGGSNDEN
jgi:hypothetical protein